jgi:hypothetical protein
MPPASGAPRASAGCRISTAATVTPSRNATNPNSVHAKKYPAATTTVRRSARLSPVRPTA